MFCAFWISDRSWVDVIVTVRRAVQTGRQLKQTSVFERYLADLFSFNRAASAAIL